MDVLNVVQPWRSGQARSNLRASCEPRPPHACVVVLCLAERDPKQSKILIYTVRWLRTRPSSILQYTIESRQVRRPAPGPNRSRVT